MNATSSTCAPGATCSTTVACDAGKVPTGGSVVIDGGNGVLRTSGFAGSNAWVGTIENTTESSQTYEVAVICVNL
ncbi:hypothetical protein [Streptomyces sp. NPDC127084]|uniref:hypothetical protein n=1 Tax=Streptomyces sp. NPDC127084 TaxID=3347133 RepID=UPI003664555F